MAGDSNSTISKNRDVKIISLLCVLAAVHVFIFSAAFPFFSIVDEQMHVDLTVDYSQGKIPRALVQANAEAIPFLVIYGCPEFIRTSSAPPPWKQPIESVRNQLAAKQNFYQTEFKNDEAAQPPLYYLLAGAWWKFGKCFGFDGLTLLYWLRFLNALLVAATVWLGWFTARKIFPENQFIQFAVPAFIAFLPQTIFYAVNNDNLSPLTFGIAFVLLIKFWQTEIPQTRLAIATGFALAATYLTKISNLPLLLVSGIFIALKIWQLAKQKQLRPAIPSLVALGICATAPMALWTAWCKIHFGDFTGSESKIKFLGWTPKSFSQWFAHPIFTPHGFWTFLSGNLQTFWQGEMLWDRQPLALPVANLFYSIASILLVTIALSNLKHLNLFQKTTLRFALAGFVAALAFFGFLSVIYDFQDCFYPSREHPYFTSGRLMLGSLIPFLLLFVYGLDCMLKKFSATAKFLVLATILVFMLAMEIATDGQIFPNDYNWFHM